MGGGVMVMAGRRANVEDVVGGRALVVVVARDGDGTLGGPVVRALVGRGDERGEVVCEIHAGGGLVRAVGGELAESLWDGEVGRRGDEEIVGVKGLGGGVADGGV